MLEGSHNGESYFHKKIVQERKRSASFFPHNEQQLAATLHNFPEHLGWLGIRGQEELPSMVDLPEQLAKGNLQGPETICSNYAYALFTPLLFQTNVFAHSGNTVLLIFSQEITKQQKRH